MDFFKPDDFRELTNWHHAAIAAIANRLLRERSQVVYGIVKGDDFTAFDTNSNSAYNTHTALLICVEPIERDSAEKILSGFVALIDEELNRVGPKTRALYDRAKKLRGGK